MPASHHIKHTLRLRGLVGNGLHNRPPQYAGGKVSPGTHNSCVLPRAAGDSMSLTGSLSHRLGSLEAEQQTAICNGGADNDKHILEEDCFRFDHPNWDLKSNDRAADLEFEIEVDSLVHGFAGYFDCVLYGAERISIHPKTLSVGMFSWFPMFFPLRHPEYLRRGSVIRSHWWRRHDAHKVWYEWALSEPSPSPVQNLSGRSWPISLL
ncbi:PRMT5 [Symbiodinium sp. CCMP2592]|nr:PRMT5 [Symbiodinium sp. CCMP2592]